MNGTIKDASNTKIYQDNKLIYDSSKDSRPPIQIILYDEKLNEDNILNKKLNNLTI